MLKQLSYHDKSANRQKELLLFLLPFFILVYLLSTTMMVGLRTTAASVSFGFGESEKIIEGMIVSVSQTNTDDVEQAHLANSDYVIGIAVKQDESSVVIDTDEDVAYVATEGDVNAYVSDSGGDIEKGDLITVSRIGGVGQKANNQEIEKIIGIAKADFSSDSEGAEQRNLTHSGKVSIGVIGVELLLHDSSYDNANDTESFVEYVGRKIVGKPVTFLQVIVSMTLVLVGFAVSGTLLYGSMRGSFLSIGRNPLSTKLIYKGMIRASLITLTAMMLGILAGYMVLII